MKHGSQGGHGVTGWLSRIGSRKVILEGVCEGTKSRIKSLLMSQSHMYGSS